MYIVHTEAKMSYDRLSRRYVGVSLKMYFDLNQTEEYVNAFNELASRNRKLGDSEQQNTTIFIIPSFPALLLPCLSTTFTQAKSTLLGAQDCHWEDQGAYTGGVSPLMLNQIGCHIVELGHAERRREPINETDEDVSRKAQAVVRNHMTPLVCIGEKERSSIASQAVGIAVESCRAQIMAPLQALQHKPGPDVTGRNPSVIFAYEPIWAIGASEPASADHVLAVISSLRQLVANKYNGDVRFLYGGSAGPGTWAALKEGCDGLFLGRFAHDVANFVKVIEEVASQG